VSFGRGRYTIRRLAPQTIDVAPRNQISVTHSSFAPGTAGPDLSEAIGITCKLPIDQRAALEQLLFFNGNQHRVRSGIEASIETYGVPEIYESEGLLKIRVGDIEGVQTLFAVCERGRPIGAAVFVRLAEERFVVLHLGVEPRSSASPDRNRRVLLRLMHEIRGAARRTRGVERIELVYRRRACGARLEG